MKYYYAPMEGITGYIYRNAHQKYFDHIDKYFAPFIVADQTGGFKTKGRNDVIPENNKDLILVPQLLTNKAKAFIHTAEKLKEIGYTEVNLNLGCPSGTVVSKNMGSGFLALTSELDVFLEEIFADVTIDISIKTRIGKESPEECYKLMEIYNKYPIKELIIHPRTQKDMYKNKPNLSVFKDALASSKNPVCYNGDIFTVADHQRFIASFPDVDRIMLGRGLLTNPALVSRIKGEGKIQKETLRDFHDEIYDGYRGILYGEKPVMHKMKEVWIYMIQAFSDHEKYAKKIMKSQRLHDYENAVERLFSEQEILDEFGY